MDKSNCYTFLQICICFFLSPAFFAQPNRHQIYDSKGKIHSLEKTSCDCKTAVRINVNNKAKYGLTQASQGFGGIQEIRAKNKGDKMAFEQEHNSSWYLLDIQRTGELVIYIEPEDSINDYDFLIYKYTDSAFCRDLLNKKILPIRGNLSRNNFKTKGITGLSSYAKDEFVAKGIGYEYSKSIEVKVGEKYMLVLDNLSSGVKGHIVYFHYMAPITISGVVTDLFKQPLGAEVLLVDEKRNEIAKTNADTQTGAYNFTATIKDDSYYSLIFYAPSFLPESEYINTRLLKPNNTSFNIDKQMKKFKIGESYPLMYVGWREQGFELYENWPTFYSLDVLLKKNTGMKIRIEVHGDYDEIKDWENSNWSSWDDAQWQLDAWKAIKSKNRKGPPSIMDWRAHNFRLDLLSKGISIDRMEIVASERMIVLKPKTEEEKRENRQVSIKVLALE